jgi:hypothetical protein
MLTAEYSHQRYVQYHLQLVYPAHTRLWTGNFSVGFVFQEMQSAGIRKDNVSRELGIERTYSFLVLRYTVSLLTCPSARQLSWDVPADKGLLHDKAAVPSDFINKTLSVTALPRLVHSQQCSRTDSQRNQGDTPKKTILPILRPLLSSYRQM